MDDNSGLGSEQRSHRSVVLSAPCPRRVSSVKQPDWLPKACVPAFEWLFDVPERPPSRKKLDLILKSTRFELALGLIVCCNIYVVIVEVDAHSRGEHVPLWTKRINAGFMACFSCELLTRFFVSRCLMFRDKFAILDIMLVGYDILNLMLLSNDTPNASILRIGRLFKVSRSVKLLRAVPELFLMLKGLIGAVYAVLWGSVLLLLLVVLWSILGVIIIQPCANRIANEDPGAFGGCTRCPVAFETVFKAGVTICQTIIAGDSWGSVAVPIIETYPATMIYFYLVFTSVALATMNLILAVIVDCALAARQKGTEDKVKEKQRFYEKAREMLRELCEYLDVDRDGMLSLYELQEGFRTVPEFGNQLKLLEIQLEDVPTLFSLMDCDSSGYVSFEEFAKEFTRIATSDMQSMVVNIRFYLTLIKRHLSEQNERLANELATKIDAQERRAEEHMLSAINQGYLEQQATISQLCRASTLTSIGESSFLGLSTPQRQDDWTLDVPEVENRLAKLACSSRASPGEDFPPDSKIRSHAHFTPDRSRSNGTTGDVRQLANELGRLVLQVRENVETFSTLSVQLACRDDDGLEDKPCSDALAAIRTCALEIATRTEADHLFRASPSTALPRGAYSRSCSNREAHITQFSM